MVQPRSLGSHSLLLHHHLRMGPPIEHFALLEKLLWKEKKSIRAHSPKKVLLVHLPLFGLSWRAFALACNHRINPHSSRTKPPTRQKTTSSTDHSTPLKMGLEGMRAAVFEVVQFESTLPPHDDDQPMHVEVHYFLPWVLHLCCEFIPSHSYSSHANSLRDYHAIYC